MTATPLNFSGESSPAFRLAAETPTLLLVDDDSAIRQLSQSILQRAGYTVLSAADGNQAIEIAEWAPFDMLITDFQMPSMNGFVLAEQITRRKHNVPVLIISGAATDDLPLQQIVDHDWSFLPKPINRIRIFEIIEESCHGELSRSGPDHGVRR